MKRIYNIFLSILVVGFLVSYPLFSDAMMGGMMCGKMGDDKHDGNQHDNAKEKDMSDRHDAELVGNKICPISGETIDEKMKETYEYKGKIYNFCCPVCVEEFKEAPEKYIEKMEKEKAEENKGHKGHEKHHHHVH